MVEQGVQARTCLLLQQVGHQWALATLAGSFGAGRQLQDGRQFAPTGGRPRPGLLELFDDGLQDLERATLRQFDFDLAEADLAALSAEVARFGGKCLAAHDVVVYLGEPAPVRCPQLGALTGGYQVRHRHERSAERDRMNERGSFGVHSRRDAVGAGTSRLLADPSLLAGDVGRREDPRRPVVPGLAVGRLGSATQVSSVRVRRVPSVDDGSLTVHTSLVGPCGGGPLPLRRLRGTASVPLRKRTVTCRRARRRSGVSKYVVSSAKSGIGWARTPGRTPDRSGSDQSGPMSNLTSCSSCCIATPAAALAMCRENHEHTQASDPLYPLRPAGPQRPAQGCQ